jgi:hypothetical protein
VRRPWKRDNEDSSLERRLRAERPRPSDELVRRTSGDARPRGGGVPKLRLGLAASVSGLAIAAVIALGGLASPINTAKHVVQFNNAGGHEGGRDDDHGKDHGDNDRDHGKPSKHEYDEKVTICHRPPGNPSNGQTLRLPREAAEAHLRNHPFDTRGPCPPPPPPKWTICHRDSKKDHGHTLVLPRPAAEAHLREHRYDSLGACH